MSQKQKKTGLTFLLEIKVVDGTKGPTRIRDVNWAVWRMPEDRLSFAQAAYYQSSYLRRSAGVAGEV